MIPLSFVIVQLSQLYTVANTADLFNFLLEHPDLVGLLFEAHQEAKKYFDFEQLRLEVVADSETGSTKELFVYVLTSLPVDKALQQLNAFDEEWFINQLGRTNGLFNFNPRFA